MKKIETILIANRGEISSRVARTCRNMGIRSVAVYSDADKDAPFVGDADMAVHIGPSSVAESYLNQEKIIAAAKAVGADAIHPGYGFLSENSAFAKLCEQNDICWIGPHPEAIHSMGSKSLAKQMMIDHGVPTVPGYQGKEQSEAKLQDEAAKIGYPLLLKATAGGGGKGMRIVREEKELDKAIQSAKREAKSAFGDDELIIEKYIDSGRHIEFQIFGDKHGNVIHLHERECSIQRRYQKVMEESPSPIMTPELRDKMGAAAVNAAKALKYDNAGTVEFIYDDKSGEFYFLEVNTRLQVEHPVTEEITGLDLVQMQIESAMGLALQVEQANVPRNGYALELRLYAENPDNNFLPETGSVHCFDAPDLDGFRLETSVRSGSEISIYYDPMIAKLVVHADNRSQAISKMKYVLEQLVCLGVTTNQGFLLDLMKHQKIHAGNYNTHFIQEEMSESSSQSIAEQDKQESLIAASIHSLQERKQNRTILKHLPLGWRNSPYQDQSDSYELTEEDYKLQYRVEADKMELTIGDNSYDITDYHSNGDLVQFAINGIRKKFSIVKNEQDIYVHHPEAGPINLKLKDRLPVLETESEKGSYIAPMPSQVISVLVKEGDKVSSGSPVIVLSSMKMENTISAIEDGIVKEVFVAEGQNISSGTELISIDVTE